jgi:hypothetical protein
MRKRQAQLVKPIVEITPTDTHLHSGVVESGQRLTLTVDDVVAQLGYQNVEKVTPASIEELGKRSELRRDYLEEALRLKGVYSPSSDSVLFVADEKWTKDR